MKRNYLLALAAVFALLTAGCSALFGPDMAEFSGGKLLIKFAGKDGKTLYPDISAGFTDYDITLQKLDGPSGSPEGAPVVTTGVTDASISVEVPYGYYDIEVTAYDGSSDVIGYGTKANVHFNTDGLGAVLAVTITIEPVDDQGDGTFEWDLDFSDLTSSAGIKTEKTGSLKLYEFRRDGDYAGLGQIAESGDPGFDVTLTDTELNNGAYNSTIDIAPGCYWMVIEVATAYQKYVIEEAVWIRSNLNTKASYVIEDADFTELKSVTGTLNYGTPVFDTSADLVEILLYKDGLLYAVFPVQPGTSGAINATIPKTLEDSLNLAARKNDNGTYTYCGVNPNSFSFSGTGDESAFNLTLMNMSAAAGAAVIDGLVGTPISSTTVTVTLTGASYVGTIPLTGWSWITNLPAGLSYTAARTSSTVVTLTITGTPTEPKKDMMAITVPAGASNSLPAGMPVTPAATTAIDIGYGISKTGGIYYSDTQTTTPGGGTGSPLTFNVRVNSGDGTNGTFKPTDGTGHGADQLKAQPGDTVYVTTEKTVNYVLKEIIHTIGGTGTTVDTVNRAGSSDVYYISFTMPSNHVTSIQMMFQRLASATIEFSNGDIDNGLSASASGGSVSKATAGTTVSVGLTAPAQVTYEVIGWRFDGADVYSNIRTMAGAGPGETVNSVVIGTDNVNTLPSPLAIGMHTLTLIIAPIGSGSADPFYTKYVTFFVTD